MRQIKKNNIINERRKTLLNFIYNNKLDFKEVGNCYTYIHYGFPPLSKVTELLINENNLINENKYKLFKILKKNNIVYNENMQCCKAIMNNEKLDLVDMDNIIEEARFEDFLIKNTQYLDYLNILDKDSAINKAIQECKKEYIYINNHKKNDGNIIVNFN